MKIGIVCYPSYGGSGVVATELGKQLAQRGHKVHFITYDMPFRLIDSFHENIVFHEIEISNYPLFKFPPYILSLANKIVEVSEREKLDIIHGHYAVPHATGLMLAKQMLNGKKVKTVVTLHGTDVTIMGQDDSLKDITAYSVKNCDGITAVSNDLCKTAQNTLAINEGIKTIYNFIDVNEFKPQPCNHIRDIFATKDEKIIIHISNFRPVKRIEDVIKTFYQIQKSIPSKLIMLGDGPEQRAAYQLGDQLGIRDRIFFLGKQNSVVKLLCIGDLFLLPSEKESFGLSALEAMACGVPVIATHTGGLPEVVENGVSGYLAPVGDIDTMSKYGIHILEDEKRHREFKTNARNNAVEKFSVEKIVPIYEEYFQSLIQDI